MQGRRALVEFVGVKSKSYALRTQSLSGDDERVQKIVADAVEQVGKGPLPDDVQQRLDEIAAMVPYRPFEEPMVLPMGQDYYGPGMANLGQGIQVGKL